jgi:hypothetical protein
VFLRAPLVLLGWDIHFLLNGQATSTSGRRDLREDDGCGDAAASERSSPQAPSGLNREIISDKPDVRLDDFADINSAKKVLQGRVMLSVKF